MSRFLTQTQSLYPSPIGSALGRSDLISHRCLLAYRVITVLICGLFSIATPALADRDILNQTVTVSDNGQASNLFVPGQTTLYLNYNVEPGKQILLMIITEAQWEAVSAGEKPSGEPVLRTTVSGTDTTSINLERGTYIVFMSSSQGPTQVTLRVYTS